MDLGALGAQRLPAALVDAYGASTAQELADRLGVTKRPGPELFATADAAWRALKAGDRDPARRLLIDGLGVTAQRADEALDRSGPAIAAFSRPGRHIA